MVDDMLFPFDWLLFTGTIEPPEHPAVPDAQIVQLSFLGVALGSLGPVPGASLRRLRCADSQHVAP
jgi:hypothetical protein